MEKNFLQETKRDILRTAHSIEDIMFIGSEDGKYRVSYKEFEKIGNFEYDNDFGGDELAKDIIVYFKDTSYLERRSYDGSSWWEYVQPKRFSETDTYKKYSNILMDDEGNDTLETLNN